MIFDPTMQRAKVNRSGAAVLLSLAELLSIAGCGSPKRDFGAPAGGESGVSDSTGGASPSGGTSGTPGAGDEPAGSGANGELAGDTSTPGGGSAGDQAGVAGVGGEPPAATSCEPTTQRSCAEAGILGSCGQGTQVCGVHGTWAACSVAPQAKDTCATGNDDTCNGMVNEGCACVIGAERSCLDAKGNCAVGKQTCSLGTWSACSIAPQAQDTCAPGDDANCNGTPNEGCSCTDGKTQSCGHAAVGKCKPGTSTCSAGAWGTCTGDVVAVARDCSSSDDNDCNGVIDNKDSTCQCNPSASNSCSGGAKCKSSGSSSQCVACLANADCKSPPVTTCSGSKQTSYATSGTCSSNTCSYKSTSTTCAFGCATTGGACKPDPCAGVTCKNGGTCSAGACACTNRFNGALCEYQRFRGLGVLSGDRASYVNAMSRDGKIVVGQSEPFTQYPAHAFRSVNGGALQPISALPDPTLVKGCNATGVDSAGTVVGDCQGMPFQCTAGSSQAQLLDLSPISTSTTGVVGGVTVISANDQVIVGSYRLYDSGSGAFYGFRWTSSGAVQIPALDSGDSYATSVSGDGSVVVGTTGNGGSWWWTQRNDTVGLKKDLDSYYDANDVSTDGKVIVGTDSTNAVEWSGTLYAALSVLGSGTAYATNSDGSVTVGTDTNLNVARIWDNGGEHFISDLLSSTPDLNGWTLTSAVDVSDDGKFIIGSGTNANQGDESWIAHLP